MMEQTKHTELPWSVGGTAFPNTPLASQNIWGPIPAGMQSGEMVAMNARPENSALIVRAVNSHQAVCDALHDTLRILEAVRFTAGLTNSQLERINRARAALARAKGEA